MSQTLRHVGLKHKSVAEKHFLYFSWRTYTKNKSLVLEFSIFSNFIIFTENVMDI